MTDFNIFAGDGEGELGTDRMREALSAIALEMRRFHEIEIIPNQDLTKDEKTLQHLIKCKSLIKLKKKQIHKLRDDLKTACIVAKTVLSAKDNEKTLINNQLMNVRNECTNLTQKMREKQELIYNVVAENRALRNKVDNINNFIRLGYQEVQKMRNETAEDIAIEMQLKNIIFYCGQYYTDFINEHNKLLQLEQKNRFLNNKIIILENNIESMLEETKNLRYQNVRHQKEVSHLKNKETCQCLHITDRTISESTMRHSYLNLPDTIITKLEPPKKSLMSNLRSLDLTSHFSTVKNLLNDQESLLEDLKSISQELITLDSVFL